MIWIIHILAGAAIGILLGPLNIGLALMAAFISHYLLDALPHWDYENYTKLSKRQALKRIWKAGLDLVLAIVLIYLCSQNNFRLALTAGLTAILPDINTGFNIFFPNRISRPLEKIHDKVHFPKNKTPLFWEILIQTLLIAIAVYLLLSQTRL